jgi:hypothetical protein
MPGEPTLLWNQLRSKPLNERNGLIVTPIVGFTLEFVRKGPVRFIVFPSWAMIPGRMLNLVSEAESSGGEA